MQRDSNKLTTPNPFPSMDQTKLLDDLNKGEVNSIVTGNPLDVRSLLGRVTEQDGRIVKAEVGSRKTHSSYKCDFRQLLYNGLDG